jgi:hypothetical protein
MSNSLKEFVRETLNEVSPVMMASMSMASKKNPQPASANPATGEKHKLADYDLIYITAKKLGIEPELVEKVIDPGIFGAFKKKDPKLTPELVKSIKEKFEEMKKKHS